MPDWNAIATAWHNEQPHPKAPGIKVGEFATATKLAAVLKFGGEHPSPQEAEGFWKEFQAMNQRLELQKKAPVSPEEFTHLATQVARVSYTYHGRPPSMYEIARLRDAHPKEVTDYFGSLPDENYPHVAAKDMVSALQAARPWAQEAAKREPTKDEAAYFVHSGESPRDYYQRMQQSGTDDTGRPQPGVAGAGDDGRQPTGQPGGDPRLAGGLAVAGRSQGVPAG